MGVVLFNPMAEYWLNKEKHMGTIMFDEKKYPHERVRNWRENKAYAWLGTYSRQRFYGQRVQPLIEHFFPHNERRPNLQQLLRYLRKEEYISKELLEPVLALLRQEHYPFSEEDVSRKRSSSTSIARNGVWVFWRLYYLGYEYEATSLIFHIAAHFGRRARRLSSENFNIAQFMYDATTVFAFERFAEGSFSVRGESKQRALILLALETSPFVRDKILFELMKGFVVDRDFFDSEWRDFRRIFLAMRHFPKKEISKELLRCAGVCIKRFSTSSFDKNFLSRTDSLVIEGDIAKARVELIGFRKWLDGKDLVVSW